MKRKDSRKKGWNKDNRDDGRRKKDGVSVTGGKFSLSYYYKLSPGETFTYNKIFKLLTVTFKLPWKAILNLYLLTITSTLKENPSSMCLNEYSIIILWG